MMYTRKLSISSDVKISWNSEIELLGSLHLPEEAKGLVIFVHGSGSTRQSSRNKLVSQFLHDRNCGTLLFDLLTTKENKIDELTREFRFNIPLLSERLMKVTEWIFEYPDTKHLTVGYFGASTGAAAALIAAAEFKEKIKALVSRGGRPDLAGHALSKVTIPTLFIVGGSDFGVIELNEKALLLINGPKKLEIIPNATHLFEEPGALEEVGRMAGQWFNHYL